MGQLSIDFSSSREPLMAIDQVAQRLGVTVRHVRRLVDERRIPYLKWGKLLRTRPRSMPGSTRLAAARRERHGPAVPSTQRRQPR